MLLSKYCGKTNRITTLFLMDTSMRYLVGNFYSMALVNGEDYTSGALISPILRAWVFSQWLVSQ